MKLQKLIENLKKPEFREKVMYDFSVIIPGNWEAVVQWAKDNNCSTTIEELKKYAKENSGFFKERGKQPALGWNKLTLDEG